MLGLNAEAKRCFQMSPLTEAEEHKLLELKCRKTFNIYSGRTFSNMFVLAFCCHSRLMFVSSENKLNIKRRKPAPLKNKVIHFDMTD